MIFRNRMRGKIRSPEEQQADAARKREQIVNDAMAMKRLSENQDFQRFCQLLEEDRGKLIDNLLNEHLDSIMTNEQNARLKARINQIDRCLNKPRSLIWQMENLPEVIEAKKAKSHERQALGTKTGG